MILLVKSSHAEWEQKDSNSVSCHVAPVRHCTQSSRYRLINLVSDKSIFCSDKVTPFEVEWISWALSSPKLAACCWALECLSLRGLSHPLSSSAFCLCLLGKGSSPLVRACQCCSSSSSILASSSLACEGSLKATQGLEASSCPAPAVPFLVLCVCFFHL